MQHIKLNNEPVLTAKLGAFPYQIEAVTKLKNKNYGAIFHEQGLGKSKIAIDLLLYWLETRSVDTVIVVTKKSLVRNWEKELELHTHICPHVLDQNKSSNFYIFNSPARVIVAHYEVVQSEINRLKLYLKTRSVGVLLDESQKFKNPDSKLTQALFELSDYFAKKFIITGTPIANRVYDIWSQIYFLDGGKSLGTDFAKFKADTDFTKELDDSVEKQEEYKLIILSLYDRIEDFSVRETKSSGILSLPDKIYHSILCDWSNVQEIMYKSLLKELQLYITKNGVPHLDEADDILKLLLRLIQISSNPALIDENYTELPGKIYYLDQLLSQIVSSNEKAILWTSFNGNVHYFKSRYTSYQPATIYGKLDIRDRNRNVDRFISNDDCKLLIATPGSAKEGLTLTVANHAIFYDRTFSLDDYLQAQDRIHRISQTKTCHVYNLILESSVDCYVDVLIEAKDLVSRLALRDIGASSYDSSVRYDFNTVLQGILSAERGA